MLKDYTEDVTLNDVVLMSFEKGLIHFEYTGPKL